jgi:hypothetical protein
MWSNHESSPASTSSLWCTVSFAGAVSSLNRIWAHASIVHRRDPSHLLSPHPFPTISFSSPSNHCQLSFCSRLRILAIAITSGPRCDIPPSTKSRHLYAPRRLKLHCQSHLDPFLLFSALGLHPALSIPKKSKGRNSDSYFTKLAVAHLVNVIGLCELKFLKFYATYILFNNTHEYPWVVWVPWVVLSHNGQLALIAAR